MPGSKTDSVVCTCNAGFYGDGIICSKCKVCDVHANMSLSCSGGLLDTTGCLCQSGYYGTGVSCASCKICSAFATMTKSCDSRAVQDTVECSCNAGYYGSGTLCSLCNAGSYSVAGKWQLFTVEKVQRS